jgi:uncharacterized protein DUF2442
MRPPRITKALPLADHWLRLWFSDGAVVEVDVAPLLEGPVFAQIRSDADLFEQVAVDRELGTITWPGDLDLDPDVLYGKHEPDPPIAFERRVIRAAHGSAA